MPMKDVVGAEMSLEITWTKLQEQGLTGASSRLRENEGFASSRDHDSRILPR
jgi:hypothetical protein